MRAKDPTVRAASMANRLGISRQRVCQVLKALGLPTRTTTPLYHRPEYQCWWNMIDRCTNPEHMSFEWYGGRGISVCDRWRASFLHFLADMGERPSLKHSIDRYPNNDGNYEPGNCRWATRKQQAENQRFSTKNMMPVEEATKIWLAPGTVDERLAEINADNRYEPYTRITAYRKLGRRKRSLSPSRAAQFP